MAPSPQKYEYIVFKGTDVKDIREETEQEQNKPEPPQPPQDPAILVGRVTTEYPFTVMKYFGCKSQTCAECAKPCRYFPLPSF